MFMLSVINVYLNGVSSLRIKLLILSTSVCFFLASCSGSTNSIKSNNRPSSVTPSSKSRNFLSKIKRIKEINDTEVTEQQSSPKKPVVARRALPTPKPAPVQTEPKASPAAEINIAKAENISNKETVVASFVHKPKINEKRFTVSSGDVIADSADPVGGIIIDEAVVDGFKENYKPIAEADGFIETEENLVREDMKNEAIPVDIAGLASADSSNAEEDIPVLDKEALEEYEALRKLRTIQDLNELNEFMKAEKAKELEKLIAVGTDTYDIPIVINKKVEYFVKYFQGRKMRKIFAKWLNRSTKYLPMMRRIFHEKGLPMDLTYLAMIESGFNTSAYSRARAVGPWQFMSFTGKRYGLKIDHWVDERRDPEKSTIAAANYLSDLYAMFDSWYLAAAAYNAGEGKIGRGLKRHKTEDFWELSKYRYLRRETKNYIPKFLAATLISKNPAKYGFRNIVQQPVYSYDIVEIKEPTDLDVIAKSAGVRLSVIKALNPELRRWYTPPERKVYELKIPKNTKKRFLKNYSKLKPSEKISFLTYRIRYGETLSEVANRFGTSVSAIMRTNKIRSARYVRAGVELTIPIREGTKIASYRRSYKSNMERSDVILVPKGETITYTVKRGDSLWEIATRSGVEVTDIISLNKIKSSRIYPGKKLLLYKNPAKVYALKSVKAKSKRSAKSSNPDNGTYHTVRAGDSLWTISRKYGTTVSKLRKLNNMRRRSTIRPRQKILVATKPAGSSSNNIQLAAATTGSKTHRVRRGDTLWEIAKKYDIGVSEIKRLNNLRTNKIKPGDELRVK